ncbi:MAG: VTT domain-containing protein [Proteobacteria bacterium]|nr:VTT domain-containing protein [Pseudomonadota bacterium]
MKILECTLCGSCLVCPYLKKYGYPKEIYLKKDKSAFICTNCRLCDRACPLDIEPSKAIYEVKSILIKEGTLTKPIIEGIIGSRRYANRLSSFPFQHIEDRETIFFPGCSLISLGRKLVFGLKNWIEKKIGSKVGLAIHCCGDPMWQNGDLSALRDFSKSLSEKLENAGVSKIIFACANCKKIFKEYLPEFELIHVSELVTEEDVSDEEKGFILHNPCPNFVNNEIKVNIEMSFKKTIVGKIDNPRCCGLGGLANRLDKEVAQEFLNNIHANSTPVLTSCMGCRNRFMKRNLPSKHIYENILGIDLKKPIGEAHKLINQILVATLSKLNFFKIFVLMIIILGSILVYNLEKTGLITIERILNLVRSSKILAPVVYLLIYSIGPTFFFPSLLLTILSGIIWGPVLGVIFAISGATIGCSIPFLLSRYIFHDYVKKLFGVKRWKRLKDLVDKNGWKVVAFTRIIPIFPFPVLNYLFGITPVKFIHYVIASFIFMLPACIAYVYFGSSIFQLISTGNFFPLIISILIISLVMIVPWFLQKFKITSKKTDE